MLALPVQAAQPEDDDFVLEEIVVHTQKPLGEGAGTATILDEDDLRALEARDAAEAMAHLPAVRISVAPLATIANGKQEQLISLRGFDPLDTKVLIDGIPVEDPYQGTVDLSRLPIGAIAQLTVARGPTSLLYGPNAMGGVVNLVSRAPAERLTGLVRLETDDLLARRVLGRLSVPAGPLSLFASVGYGARTGFRVPHGFEAQRNENGGLRDNSDTADLTATAKATWRLPKSQRVQVTAHYIDHEGGVPFSVSALEPGTMWRRKWRRLQVEAAGLVRPWSWLTTRGKLFWSRFDNAIETYSNPSMQSIASGGAAISTHEHNGLGAFVHPEFDILGVARIGLAADWRIDWMTTEPDTLPDTESRNYRSEQFSLALEGEVSIAERVKLIVGASWVGLFKEKAAGANPGDDLNTWEALAGLRVVAWPGAELHAGYARKVGLPRLRYLYGSYGNPDLKPQFGHSLQVGIAQRLDFEPVNVEMEAAWFRNDLRDFIAKRDTGNELVFENIAEALITGVEARLSASFDDRYTLRAGYTWLHTEDHRQGRVVEELDFRAAHTFDVGFSARFDFGLQLNADLRWQSSRPYEQPSAQGPVAKRFPARAALDLGISQTFEGSVRPGQWVRIYLRLLNSLDALAAATKAFDVYYEDGPERPGAGWTLRFGLEARL